MQSNRAAKRMISRLRPTIIVGVFCLAIWLIYLLLRPVFDFVREQKVTPGVINSILFNSEPPLKSINGRTNIVLLGLAGGVHDGADLTDTILFFSIDFSKRDAVLISVPRDLWLPSLKTRINNAYHAGEEKRPGGGMVLAKAAIEEVLGQPVQYAVVVDFAGFVSLIDMVGGVDITIERTFDDYLYPIPGKENDPCDNDPKFMCRYEHLHFDKGMEHMNGERALKYVRSRQSQDVEGTDFARSRRQQQVLFSLKEKLSQTSFLSNLDKMKQLLTIVQDTVKSDMNWSEKVLLGKYASAMKEQGIRRIILDDGDEKNKRPGFLVNPPQYLYNGAWVLVPRTESFDEIHAFIACHLENPQCTLSP